MSAYKEIRTEYRSFKALKSALIAVFGEEIQAAQSANDNFLALQGFLGDAREERAALVVPRRVLNRFSGGQSNDLGYAYDPESQTYREIVSAYDQGRPGVTAARGKVKQEYAFEKVKAQARAKGLTVSREDKNGQILVKVRR